MTFYGIFSQTLIFLSCFYIRADFRTVCLFGYQIIFSGSFCYFSRYIHVFWIFYLKKKIIIPYTISGFLRNFSILFSGFYLWRTFQYFSAFFTIPLFDFVLNNLRILLMFLLVFFQMLLNVFILINDLNLNCDWQVLITLVSRNLQSALRGNLAQTQI